MAAMLLALGAFALTQDVRTNYDLTVECTVLATASAEAVERAEPQMTPSLRKLADAGTALLRKHAQAGGTTADQVMALIEQRVLPYRNAFAKVSNPTDHRNAALNLGKKAVERCKAVIENWKRYEATR